MATLSSTGRFAAGEACADNDILYGPYATTAAAHAALLNAEQNVVGRTIGIQTGNTIEEYWYQGGTTEQHLVKKQVAAQEETDPTVPSWAKQSTKPSYDYSEIGNTPDLSGFITKSVNDLTNYYLKSETYTKAEVAALIGAIQQFHYEIYASLPQSGESNVLYLIGPTGSGSDRYEEYVYSNNTWNKIGDTSIDLSGYVTTSALNTALADYTTTSNLTALLSNKADKVSNATNGNFAGLDENGNLTDSGKKASDFATSSQGAKADTAIQTIAVGTTTTSAAGTDASVTNSGTATNPILEFTIPRGVNGQDGEDAYNPFKGTYLITDTLPTTGQDGDYIYVIDSQTPPVTHLYTWNGTAFVDSGGTVTIGDSQFANSTKPISQTNVVNDLTTGGTEDVLSAEQGKVLGDEVFQYVYKNNNISTNPYANDVAEVYITATLIDTITNISLRSYSNTLYFRALSPNNLFTCRLEANEYSENGVVYELKITATNDSINYPIGKLIGYIVFKDIAHFKAYSIGLDAYYINLDRAYKLNLTPLVLKYLSVSESSSESSLEIATELSNLVVDNLTTDDSTKALSAKQGKILGDEVFQYVYQVNDVSTNYYANDVAELYLMLNFDETNKIQLKHYDGKILLANRTLSLTCRLSDSLIEDNKVYELKITTSSNVDYPVGTLMAYIVFKNITHFKGFDIGSPQEPYLINNKRAFDFHFNQKCFKESENYIIESTVEDAIESTDFPTYLNGVEVNLPDEIVVSKGDRLQVFWRNVCTAFNPYSFDVFGQCKLGNNYFGYSYPRYFQFDATDDMVNNSTYPFTVYVRNNNAEVIASKSTNIRVVDKISTPSQNKNVLIIGASATANGNIIYELNRRLNTATGYEYKWTVNGSVSSLSLHINDIYKDSKDNQYKITELGSDYIGVIKTVSASTASTSNILTLVNGDSGSPQTFTTIKSVSSYSITYEKPYGLNTQRFNFIGTTHPSGYSDLYQEARGGWSWQDYSTVGRYAYRFYVTGQTGIMEGAKYQGNGTLVFTVTNDIQLDSSGTGNFSCTFTGSGTQPASGTLIKISGNGPAVITYDSFSIDSQNPFWNNTTSQLDFDNYATNIINVASVDLVIFHLGVNDIFSSRTSSDCVGYMHTLIDAIHSAPQFANAKIIVSTLPMPSPYGGMTTNYGASSGNSYFAKAKQFWIYGDAFNDFAKESGYSDFVQLATPLHTFDAEHLYPQTNIQVDNRCSETETIQTNGVHPIDIGGYTVADDIYHSIMKVMQ